MAGGGFAALLATLGIGGFGVEEADAKKRCKKRCKKKKNKTKRRRCKRRCRKNRPSTPGGPGPECEGTGDCQGTDICVDNECVARPVAPIACDPQATEPCAGGLVCVQNVCLDACQNDNECDGDLLCLEGFCVLDTECDTDTDCQNPLLGTCLLGLCVDDPLP